MTPQRTPPTSKQMAITLRNAARLIATKGWVQNAWGKTRDGHEVTPRHLDEAVCFCAYGAIKRVEPDDYVSTESARIVSKHLIDEGAVHKTMPKVSTADLMSWNDTVAESSGQVVALLRRVADSLYPDNEPRGFV